jgi:hypothetical protein
MPITISEAMARLARERGDANPPNWELFPPGTRIIPSIPAPAPDAQAIARAVRAELREREQQQQREAPPRPAPVVRRSKEFADELVFHAALLAACNAAWRKNRQTAELTVNDALIVLQETSSRGLSRRTFERYLRQFYRGWGGWLAIWHAERPARGAE